MKKPVTRFNQNPLAVKISARDVVEIRKRLDRGELVKNLAKIFPISETQLYRIRGRKRWKVIN